MSREFHLDSDVPHRRTLHVLSRGSTALQASDDWILDPMWEQIRAIPRSTHGLSSEIGTRAELRCKLVTSRPSFAVTDLFSTVRGHQEEHRRQ